GHGRGRDALLVLVHEQVDLPPRRVTEGGRDGGDGRREIGGGEGRPFHGGYSTYRRSGNPLARRRRAPRGGAAAPGPPVRRPPGASCPSPKTRSSRPSAPSKTPSCTAASSTSTWCAASPSTATGSASRLRSPSPAARCGPRSATGSPARSARSTASRASI